MRTFTNPVHRGVLADPFVLKWKGRYYAYGTPGHGAIPILTSTDLVEWTPAGRALDEPPTGSCYWAPEVAYDNGRFFLYYSCGGSEGEGHQLRVATATAPTGPFRDEGVVLDAGEPFTIDAHPFKDDDGSWYLFYCRDFLEGDRVGTGIVVDRLVDMVGLAGQQATVVRPHAEWHLFERGRRWYERVWDWYTLEGPFVRRRDGRYWCFFSGGAWRAAGYGVGCAVANHPLGPYTTVGDPEGPVVLTTVPKEAIGPGHASIVAAPDNVTDYLVYHAWDPALTGRYMRTDRLVWTTAGPGPSGPTTDQQPRPAAPDFRDLFGGPGAPGAWQVTGGRWELGPDRAMQLESCGAGGAVAVAGAGPTGDQLVELNVAQGAPGPPELPAAIGAGAYGAVVRWRDGQNHTVVAVDPAGGVVRWRAVASGEEAGAGVLGWLRPDFAPGAFHQLLLACRGASVEVRLDGVPVGRIPAAAGAGRSGLWTGSGATAAFAGFAVTAVGARS